MLSARGVGQEPWRGGVPCLPVCWRPAGERAGSCEIDQAAEVSGGQQELEPVGSGEPLKAP